MAKFWLVLMTLLSTHALAKDADVYIGGRYNCDFDVKPSFVKADGPFTLEILQDGVRSRTRKAILRSADQFTLTAIEFSGSNFHKVETDFPIKKNREVAYVNLTGDDAQSAEVAISLAFNTEPDIFEFDRLKCVGESIVKKVPIVQLDCTFMDWIKNVETPVQVRFALANMADPQDFLILTYGGVPGHEKPVEVAPRRSYFSSLNESLSAVLTRDYMLLTGDAKGKFVSRLRINRPPLTQGIAWLESGSEEVPESRRSVFCTVKGRVTPAPQERLH